VTEGLRPSDSPTRALARRFDGSLRSRGSLARSLAIPCCPTPRFMRQVLIRRTELRDSRNSPHGSRATALLASSDLTYTHATIAGRRFHCAQLRLARVGRKPGD